MTPRRPSARHTPGPLPPSVAKLKVARARYGEGRRCGMTLQHEEVEVACRVFAAIRVHNLDAAKALINTDDGSAMNRKLLTARDRMRERQAKAEGR